MAAVCSIDSNDFARFLADIFKADDPLDDSVTSSLLQSIPDFTIFELEGALAGLSNMKGADENGKASTVRVHARPTNGSGHSKLTQLRNDTI